MTIKYLHFYSLKLLILAISYNFVLEFKKTKKQKNRFHYCARKTEVLVLPLLFLNKKKSDRTHFFSLLGANI